ncbi:septum site-determining protein MinC [Thiomicrospira aerophila AL3]|uniref:Probable septum site-determining protein MinC n=1 Tax=Thiomicrospira aerophila AL3 TaxID=717772 RepID=W0DUK2_9GAMM|nr:septum site-determining protein MinC [Thiomicrospira aerophila]AHF00968.1 septum site-determining protein MinC [Thiomicrospira aerophila AL3]
MPQPVSLKGSVLSLSNLKVASADIEQVTRALAEIVGKAPAFFKGLPIVIELDVAIEDPMFLALLVEFLHQQELVPIGVRTEEQGVIEQAKFAGLAVFDTQDKSRDKSSLEKVAEVAPVEPVNSSVNETALMVRGAVRSGQQVVAKNRDLIVKGAVNPGAEVIADGHVHVYGPMRGKLFAGSNGNRDARIFVHKLDAELVCIAGFFLLADDIQPQYRGEAVEIYLADESLRFDILN